MIDLSISAWLLCAGAVALGAVVQRVTGQGFGMIAAPLVALVAPEMLPASPLILGLLVGWRAALADRNHIDFSALPWGFGGRIVGITLAVILASRLLATGGFEVAVALTVYAAIALSLVGVRVAINRVTLVLAGFAGGLMATLTAIGAPPTALLYQYEERRHASAMMNTFFVFGMLLSIGGLALTGLIRWPQVAFAASLLPPTALGLWAAPMAIRMTETLPTRAFALTLSGTAATVLLLRSL